MPHWTESPTNAHAGTATALATVDSILGYARDGRGRPTDGERALFAAAVVFIYGIWENFVEQLAVEVVSNVASEVKPEQVPDQVRRSLEKRSAWELTVSPGWRTLWSDHVRVQAIGDDGEKFGLNTAKAGQVQNLLSQVGVAAPYVSIPTNLVPQHLPEGRRTVVDAINSLVELRGAIVHTGNVPDTLRKGHVLAWRRFVEVAVEQIDSTCRTQCRALVEFN